MSTSPHRLPRPSQGDDYEPVMMAGIEVREADIEPVTGLTVAGVVFRICTVIILLLAAWQAWDWFSDPPPGGAGLSVIIGDTIRLIVVSFLLYGAADLADLFVKSFQEQRATRILLARQTYLMKQLGVASGELPAGVPAQVDRRGLEAEESVAIAKE